ncbi:copper homeostasis membrane protein CopD [Mesorhizobium sp. B2-3-5]|uniref:copper homeostasis membrane protein CopD n=1 Tax=Mesorhizobium sp. B2-3-5 TaxID=2589958 RepID=UPI00112A029D|nr:copper homeostasis membrane protein CopD [Mesorhizobium sp. B2-3-5]TPM34402.1 copper homeostasis membrane protein CopD [Mesorhizobium sp. B2-3-5]
MMPDTFLMACRFVHDAALMMLWGGFGYLAALVPRRLAGPIADRLAGSRLVAVGLALATTLLALPIQTAMIGDGWTDAVNGRVLTDVLMTTSVGTAWLAQLAAVVILVFSQLSPARFKTAATAGAAALGLAALAFSGHAVMQGGWQGVVHPLNDVLHVLAAGAWIGALPPLLIVLAQFGQPPFKAEATVALRRFSTAGHWAVALAILSGIGNSLFIVGWPLGISPTYRALLTAKIVVVFLMTAAAILNRYWFVPRLGRHRASALAAIRTGTLAEIGLGLAAILLVSIFGLLDPIGGN